LREGRRRHYDDKRENGATGYGSSVRGESDRARVSQREGD
jgi:hypothetical protein